MRRALRPIAEIDAERREAILARQPLVPKLACHYCDYEVPRREYWCCSDCADSYAAERDKLLNGIGSN